MIESQPIISVIVPVYNTGKNLRSCLDSVLAQTFTALEIIVVDDGSDDIQTLEILNEYKSKDHRIRLIRKANGGQSSARNVGLAHACGIYVAFVDHDDVLNNHMYEILFEASEKGKVDVVECRYQSIPVASMEMINLCHRPNTAHRRIQIDQEKDFIVDNIQIWKRICKKDFLVKNNISFADLQWEEDVLFSFKVLVCAASIRFIDEELYFHIQHEKNTTNALGRKIFDGFKAHDKIQGFLENINCLKTYEEQYRGRVLKDVLFSLNVVHETLEQELFKEAHHRIRAISLKLHKRFYSKSKKKLLGYVWKGDFAAFKRYQRIRKYRRSILEKFFKIRNEPNERSMTLLWFKWIWKA